MNPIAALLGALGVVSIAYVSYWGRAIVSARRTIGAVTSPETDARFPTLLQLTVGFVTNFFDTLGIGSYAPTTSIFKLKKMVDDKLIPGTLTVGSVLESVLQTFIYASLIKVDIITLFAMIAAATCGAWLGAGVVARLPRQKVQLGMGFALLIAVTMMLMTQLHLLPGGGVALGVTGVRLAIAVGINFALGALMTLGIGMYAPSMILVSLLGMSPKTAFPIMMGSCAFLIPVAAVRFIKEGSYALRPALGLALGGIPAVLIAAFLVREMPLEYVRWVVIVVVLYAATSMIRSAFAENSPYSAVPASSR